MKQKIDKNYVSPLDKFLTELSFKFPKKSKSQQKEIKKYARIDRLRDNPEADNEQDPTLIGEDL